ncbi:MAG: hypothetical protein COX57_07625 [Alphaproteobacteria bacterium CG_4_10_14_0_2_um_filter_63_37]|nr:MAG: hypothetical protein COX57_07625 [Alphaproteobacteria bacterium CG_4_10_14_0_2_um_filter_63_37]
MAATYSNCHGCSLCLLSCPMWLQKRDVTFSAQGMARALQNGAQPQDLAEPLLSCLLCGICDLICPEKIDLRGMIENGLRRLDPDLVARRAAACPAEDRFDASRDPVLLQLLGPDDFYVIEPRSFHAHHVERVAHYEALRRRTGCGMNLDLHRMAIPTGIEHLGEGQVQKLDVKQQIQWLLKGRTFARIVVESRCDQALLAEITGKPVVHISELIGSENAHA